MNIRSDPNGRGVTIRSKGVKRVVQARLRPPRGFWDIVVVGGVPWNAPSEAKRKNGVFLAARDLDKNRADGIPNAPVYDLRQ